MQPKSIDFAVLFPPNMNYEYFEGYESIPFKPEASGKCHLPTAWWLAEISLLAYEHPGFVKWVLRHIKASHLRYFSWDTTQLITFILNEYCIVAFRGTEIKSPKSFHDIISDMNINMTDFYGMGRVHQGFKLAFDETLDPKNNLFSHIDSLLQSGLAKKVIFTGHSMGGSLATLSTAWYGRAGHEQTPLYTYGAMRVGNEDFNAYLPKDVFRFVNNGDPFPYLPTNFPKSSKGKNTYANHGQVLFFENDTKLSLNPPAAPTHIGGLIRGNIRAAGKAIAARIRSKQFATDFFRDANMDAHAPVLYAVRIYNHLLTAFQGGCYC